MGADQSEAGPWFRRSRLSLSISGEKSGSTHTAKTRTWIEWLEVQHEILLMSQLGQSRHLAVGRPLPVFPLERTSSGRPGPSEMCLPEADIRHASQSLESAVIWRRGTLGVLR